MSQRIVITDDHSQAEIDLGQATQTRTTIILTREATDQTLTWSNLNLTDESWDELVKLVREFCPEAQLAAAEDEGQATTSNERIAAMEQAAAAPVSAPAPAAGKRDGKAVRAWWYALDAKSLHALSLPTPDRSKNIGKLPAAVYSSYDAAHAA